jgi:hypothetical protein
VIKRNGCVGINTIPSDTVSYKLYVNGGVRAKELWINTDWSDFVFEPDYRLMPLSEVESYIAKHGHLPGIPSGQQVETHGMSVGKMSSLQMMKIEELTLHMIALQKQIKQLNEENQQLKQLIHTNQR